MRFLQDLLMCGLLMCGLSLGGSRAAESQPLAPETLVPQTVVDGFLDPYTPDELWKIHTDKEAIAALCFNFKPLEINKKHYVATAGGPGSSKTTILETYLKDEPAFVYIDPDQRVLKFMNYTYRSDLNNYAISQSPSYKELLQKSYTKWRGASNYIANTLLNRAFVDGWPIAHGTTSTAPTMGLFYETLKKAGYHITLLLCVSPAENCLDAVRHREDTQAFVQSTTDDLIQKGDWFFERFPVYFRWADVVHLYWVENFKKGARQVASWTKEKGWTVRDTEGFERAKTLYRGYQAKAPQNILSFEEATKPLFAPSLTPPPSSTPAPTTTP